LKPSISGKNRFSLYLHRNAHPNKSLYCITKFFNWNHKW